MIGIYDDIRDALLKLKLKESSEYFNLDNIPDSLTDKGFTINLIDFESSSYGEVSTKQFNGKIISLKAMIKINICFRLTANQRIQKLKDSSELIGNIIKSLLSINVGNNEKNKIEFVGSNSITENNLIVSEINFEVDFRLLNQEEL